MTIPEMIRAIRATGMTQQQIADATGVRQASISRALNGAAILYSLGKSIEALYQERCGESAQAA